MDSKLPLYHWLVVLVPGCIFLTVIYLVSEWIGLSIPVVQLGGSETIRVFIFLAAALLTGELLQAIGGLIEPALFWSWGGSASKRLLAGDRYKQEKSTLRARFGEELTNDEVFERAMAYCNHLALGRSEYFNTLYAYSRSLFVATLLIIATTLSLSCYVGKSVVFVWILLIEIAIAVLLWHRTKKRGVVFVKEVLVQAALSISQK